MRHTRIQQFASTTIGMITIWVALKLYTLVGLAFSLAPLVLLTAEKWWPLFKSVGFVGLIFYGPWSMWLVKKVLRATDVPSTLKAE